MDTHLWFFGLLAVVRLGSTGAQEVVYIEEGGQLILKPTTPAVPLSSVLWKNGPDMVTEWVKSLGDVDYYGQFKGRTSLNNVTGQLEINNLTSADNGVYSVEVNGKLQSKTYSVKVIRKVPKPTVSLACSSTSDFCTLSCDGEISEAEPITYSWRLDGGDWKQSSELMNITQDDKDVEHFSCQMKNAVSVEESEPWKNPLNRAGSTGAKIVSFVGGMASCLILFGIGVLIWKKAIRKCISSSPKRNDNDTANHGEATTVYVLAGNRT